MLAQALELDEGAEQNKEKRPNEKSQLIVKRQHLPAMLRVRTMVLLPHARFGKPVGAFLVIGEMETLLRRRIVRNRKSKDQNGRKIVAVQNVITRVDEQTTAKVCGVEANEILPRRCRISVIPAPQILRNTQD
jgi:hypothetical protein